MGRGLQTPGSWSWVGAAGGQGGQERDRKERSEPGRLALPGESNLRVAASCRSRCSFRADQSRRHTTASHPLPLPAAPWRNVPGLSGATFPPVSGDSQAAHSCTRERGEPLGALSSAPAVPSLPCCYASSATSALTSSSSDRRPAAGPAPAAWGHARKWGARADPALGRGRPGAETDRAGGM